MVKEWEGRREYDDVYEWIYNTRQGGVGYINGMKPSAFGDKEIKQATNKQTKQPTTTTSRDFQVHHYSYRQASKSASAT
jgi:hypothetical protein